MFGTNITLLRSPHMAHCTPQSVRTMSRCLSPVNFKIIRKFGIAKVLIATKQKRLQRSFQFNPIHSSVPTVSEL